MSGRILIAVTHLLGTGHLSRAAMIASGLGQYGFDVTLVSGGAPAPTIGAGPYRFVQLPPVRIIGTDYGTLLDDEGAPVDDRRLGARVGALTATFRDVKPDIIITEHFPFGRRQLAREFLTLIEVARASRAPPYILASIRDIMVAPARSERVREIAQHLNSLFHAVLVHGDERFLPLDRSWPVAATGIADKLIYTGYVARPGADTPSEADAARSASNNEILVSGGGSAAALPLFKAAIIAAALTAATWSWRILVGHGVSEAQFRELVHLAGAGRARAKVIVERARSDFSSLLSACAVSVSQAGYNTVIDLLHARRPAVLVPYEEDEVTDQTLRAQALADVGVCHVCETATLTPGTLLAAIEQAIARGPPAGAAIDLGGVARTANVLGALLARSPVGEIASGRHRG